LLLSELTADARTLALVGLAKNTGKTVALAALLAELADGGRAFGVTSVGRDGEERDALDSRIEKPRLRLPAGTVLATTDSLLRASGLTHEVLAQTPSRTPLGRVLIARLSERGTIEVAGPSAAAEVRAAAEQMLEFGAEQVLIDGAIDRRAASSPAVADALVMSTGAVLSDDVAELVARTRDAVELVRVPAVAPGTPAAELAAELSFAAGAPVRSILLTADGERVELAPRLPLTADGPEIARLLAAHPDAGWLLSTGALPERFIGQLADALRRARRRLTLLAGDATRVFASERGLRHYRQAGVDVEVVRTIDLRALTVNPVAPRSHTFDSGRLRDLLAREIDGVPIVDVMDSSYGAAAAQAVP
jgi:hypothetical protein